MGDKRRRSHNSKKKKRLSKERRVALKKIAWLAVAALAVIAVAFVIDAIRLVPPTEPTAVPSTSARSSSLVQNALDDASRPVIATLGGSFTAGSGASDYEHTWAWLVGRSLGETVTLSDHGFLDLDIEQIRGADGVPAVAKSRPTVVFFEPSTFSNLLHDISVERATELTSKTITELRNQIPNVIIVGLLPSDVRSTATNSTGQDYADYIEADRDALSSTDLVCDVYTPFRNADLEVLLADDALPNDAGNAVWASTIQTCIGALQATK